MGVWGGGRSVWNVLGRGCSLLRFYLCIPMAGTLYSSILGCLFDGDLLVYCFLMMALLLPVVLVGRLLDRHFVLKVVLDQVFGELAV